MTTLRIHEGDCLDEMEWMANESVQCCVTSPPYFGLRDYGVAGQIGLEQTPLEYISRLVQVFREVRRVLKDDGTLWVNIGDSYVSHKPRGGAKHAQSSDIGDQTAAFAGAQKAVDLRGKISGLKDKDLIGIPWMLALALRADGWYLRQDIIWHKPNPMPESVTDRCTKAHEYIFLLTKSSKYYFDHKAMKEPAVKGAAGSSFNTGKTATHQLGRSSEADRVEDGMRNRRSVWTVATKPYKGAHFAVYPPDLIKPCIMAGSKVGDVVFDPFGGSGTTAEVAIKNGRKAVLCELNPEYVPLIRQRAAAALLDWEEL